MQAHIHVERGRIRLVVPHPTAVVITTETGTTTFPGGYVYPGFVDSHAHIVGLGERLALPSLHNCRSPAECVQVLSACHNEQQWLYAMGWDNEQWHSPALPDKDVLDTVFPNVAVVLRRIDGHAYWANSRAMELAGVHGDTQDPAGGFIHRDSRGLPSGLLVDNAMALIDAALPAPSSDELTHRIITAANECARRGITEVHDMDVDPAWLVPMRLLAESGRLPVRLQSFVRAQNNEWKHHGVLPAVGELHRMVGIKLFADGALGSHGAFMLEPYSDMPKNRGIQLLDATTMYQRIADAIEAGWWAVATHAIGDAANRMVLDVYERVRKAGYDDIILRIEHAQHVNEADVSRFAENNVFACVQPTHSRNDSGMLSRRLSPARYADAYRWASLVKDRVCITGGSDFPVDDASALDGIREFCLRTAPELADLAQHETLSLEQALGAYTHHAHKAVGMEYRRGSISTGYDADLVVVNNCLQEEQGFREAEVIATMMAGKYRYIKG